MKVKEESYNLVPAVHRQSHTDILGVSAGEQRGKT